MDHVWFLIFMLLLLQVELAALLHDIGELFTTADLGFNKPKTTSRVILVYITIIYHI